MKSEVIRILLVEDSSEESRLIKKELPVHADKLMHEQKDAGRKP